MGKIMIERIWSEVKSKLRPGKAGWRFRGTTEQIFILKKIVKQSMEWQTTLCVHFANFEKAFDSVHWESQWLIMQFECAVVDEEDTTERFKPLGQAWKRAAMRKVYCSWWSLMRNTRQESNRMRWKITIKLEELDFTNDIPWYLRKQTVHSETTHKVTHEASGSSVSVEGGGTQDIPQE